MRNITKGLFIKTAFIVAPVWWFVAYQHMLSNDIPLRLALSFSLLGIVTTLIIGFGLEALCSVRRNRTDTQHLASTSS